MTLQEPHLDSAATLQEDQAASAESPARRGFLASLAAILVGGVEALAPIVSGIASLLDPLRRSVRNDDMVRVTALSVLPADGAPQRFTVRSDRVDAWTTEEDVPVGAVYLRRRGEEVLAFNVVCPHAGCFVGLAEDRARFECPCHNSSFTLDGDIDDPESPSPRGMDALDVEIRSGGEVWVRFRQFQPGRTEKTPLA